jgi:hypothetical protein
LVSDDKMIHWKSIVIDRAETSVPLPGGIVRISVDPETRLLYEGVGSVEVK